MYGIDISSNNKDLIWANVKGKKVCYVKATEGLTYDNPYMTSQIAKARSLGMYIGVYHKLRANNAVEEAKHFLNITKNVECDCLYMIDGETEPVGISARIRAFSDTLAAQNKPSVLYTGLYFYNKEILPIARNIPLWVADYCSVRPSVKSIAWQYSDSNNTLDLDIFDDEILLNKSKPSVVLSSSKPVIKNAGSENVMVLQRELNLQCNAKLKIDGWPGKLTLAACPTLRIGAKGNITKWVQTKIGMNEKYHTGNFLSLTLAAIKTYQHNKGIHVDGIVGNATWNELLK